jgi:hypothetical protein
MIKGLQICLSAVGILCLTSCSGTNPLMQLTASDTAAAVTVANAAGDTAGVQCFTGLNKLASVNVSGPTGIAMKIETVRSVENVIKTQCAPLAVDLLNNVAHGLAGPFAGLIP